MFDQLQIAHPCIRDIAGFWSEARADARSSGRGDLPARGDFDPAAYGHLLPHIALWAYEAAEDRFWLRLAGERVLRHMDSRHARGAPPRGLSVEDVVTPALLPRVIASFRRIVQEPAILHNIGTVTLSDGREVSVERLVLPLADDGRHPSDLMNVVVYGGETMQSGSATVAGDHTPTTWLSLAPDAVRAAS